jgi:hypothetical protein
MKQEREKDYVCLFFSLHLWKRSLKLVKKKETATKQLKIDDGSRWLKDKCKNFIRQTLLRYQCVFIYNQKSFSTLMKTKMSSKFRVYKVLVFSEILTHSFNFPPPILKTFNHAESTDDVEKNQARRI